MDMEHIREFTVLAEIGSFTEASRRLSISQPVLSKHIKMLELDLGAQLFKRNKRSMELSEYGKLLLPYAQQIVQIQNEVADAFSSRHHAIAGTLTIGALPTASYYGLGDVISGFIQENPHVSINMIEGDYHGLIEMLTQQKCDFAFVREVEEPQNHFARIPFAMDKLTAALPEDHPLAKEEAIPLQLLKEEPFIFSSEETYSYRFCMKACKEAGFDPNIVYTNNNGKNLLDMVRKGVGITRVNKRPADVRKGEGIVLVNLTPEVRTQVSIYYNRSMNLSIAASHFLIYVNRHGESHSTDEKEKG